MERSAKGASARAGEKKTGVPRNNDLFPIVGIGASAGGLEALEEFLAHVPAGCGMAFVIVQHLDPTHKGMLPELLQRKTAMPVAQVVDGMRVKPDSVYVIPPNSDLSILRDRLQLFHPVEARGLRLPVDFFLRSLAADRLERSIGVILSGMGSDGTLGLGAIKEKAGLTLAQEPETTRFDSMPSSAIAAGVVDVVATASELPTIILDYIQHAPVRSGSAESPAKKSALDKILILLRARKGHDFSHYKKSTLYRRIERRMGLHKIKTIGQYVPYLSQNSQELELLFKELLIGVTSFFRDPAAWSVFEERALPELLEGQPQDKQMRAWVAGCSTGEEAYSLAIAFRQAVEQCDLPSGISLQIFATDLDPDAIERARQGIYPANIVADLSPEQISRFFVEEDGRLRVSKEIREMVVFATQNIIMDPPFTKLDILCCRNLLIYFDRQLQRKLLPLFHFCLNPGGLLFLGSAESIGGFEGLYAILDSKSKLFRRSNAPKRAGEVHFPSRAVPARLQVMKITEASPDSANLQSLADQLLLRKFSPPAVLVNAEGDILYINGHTGKYLEPAAGKANWNVHAMICDGLRNEVDLALARAIRNRETVYSQGTCAGSGGASQGVEMIVHGIETPGGLQGTALIIFSDMAPAETTAPDKRRRSSRAKELERELLKAKDELRSFREQVQNQHEELRSANEELQSTNEELQSTNEELTTSKEEMQSLNEELQTVNSELQSKVDELTSVSNDMENLLNSTDIATVFLDSNLHVRRFTSRATKIFRLIAGDVDRPLSDIATDLDYAGLQSDAKKVLRTLVFCEKEIEAKGDRWFQVRIMPYRTRDDVINGVVMTFTDITKAKMLEAELRDRRTTANKAEKHRSEK